MPSKYAQINAFVAHERLFKQTRMPIFPYYRTHDYGHNSHHVT